MNSTENSPFFISHETITLTKNGVWLSDGIEIDHDGTRELFFRAIHRTSPNPSGEEAGAKYEIRVGRESHPIVVEDCPYFVFMIEGSPREGHILHLSDGAQERLEPSSITYRPGRLACEISRRGVKECAKFLNAPYWDLLKDLKEDSDSYFLDIAQIKVTLAKK